MACSHLVHLRETCLLCRIVNKEKIDAKIRLALDNEHANCKILQIKYLESK